MPAACRWRGQLADAGKKVFVDLKLHDIGNTVARGVESVAKLGATFLTVHAYPQTMKAAVEAPRRLQAEDPRGHRADLLRRRRSRTPPAIASACRDLVEAARAAGAGARHRRAGLFAGRGGAACAGSSVTEMRLVTPGIRPAGAAAGDQKRIMTPARAIAAGADYLVVGRPVTEAADPKAAADAISGEIAQAPGHSRKAQTGERRWRKATGSRASMSHNMDGYKEYVAQNGAVFHKFGARFLVRGGQLRGQGRLVALAQRGARIQGLRDRARLLQFAGIPAPVAIRSPHAESDLDRSSRAMTARSR